MTPAPSHRWLSVENPRSRTPVGSAVLLAGTFVARLRGLLGRPALRPGQGLLLHPCNAVHTFGMRYPIDCVYLSAAWRVLAVADNLPPNRFGPVVRAAAMVLELPAGTARRTDTREGDLLRWRPAGNARPDTEPPSV